MNRALQLLALCLACSVVAGCGEDDHVKILVFQAAPDAIEIGQSTKLVFAVDPADAKVDISGLGDMTSQTQASVTPTATTSYQLTAKSGTAIETASVTVTVGPTSANAVKVEPMSATPTAGEQLAVTLTVLASNGKPAPGFRGTLHLTSSDAHATLPSDVVFAASDAGVKQVTVTLTTAGPVALIATDTGKASTAGSASLTVQPAQAHAYRLTTLPGNAIAGESLVLTVTVLDIFGNIATAYTGQMRMVGEPTDILPANGAFVAGVRSVSLAFTKVGSHTAQVQDLASTIPSADTSSVAIGPAAPFRVAMTPANQATTAGSAEAFTATVFDFFDNVATNYTGTLHFAASDTHADVPADFAFGAGDAGTHGFNVTFKTSGTDSLAASDTVATQVSGTATWTVGSAAATSCVASQAPSAAPAGTVLGLSVVARDGFGNVATGYAGTVRLTASDLRATLPPDVTFDPANDAGSHAFSIALLTTGAQTVTATDTADATITCSLGVTITPAAPKIVLSVPADTNAGYPVNVAVAVKDLFDNAIPSYAGTVTFVSTDTGSGAAAPAAITFAGTEGGVATASATFVTIGAQTLSASDAGTPQAVGSSAARVHGLVYTAPDVGRVRLVANPAASNTNTVQLDLVANERLEISSLFGGGPGSFSAGMNLPLDTTRAGAGAPLFAPGNALPLGTGIPAALGVLGGDHVLYTAVSRKRIAGTIFTQVADVQPGQVFYSVKLKLTPSGSPGAVFDGAQPMAMYRSGVRDQWGNDFVGQADIGVGKLEVR